jgi:cytoskeletal protein CcmA (bactofilin family)
MKDMRNLFILELFILICLSMAVSVLHAGEVLHVDESTKVKDDLVLIGKSCVMEGKVNGDVVIINGDLDLYGNVNGDAVVLNGKATLYRGTNVNGDLVIVGGKLEREEGAKVNGEVVITSVGPFRNLFKLIPPVAQFSTEEGEVKIEKRDRTKPLRLIGPKGPFINPRGRMRIGPGPSSWMSFVQGIALSIVIMLFTAIFPSGSETMTLYLEKKPGRSFFVGFLAQILFIPAILFLVLSILGIPLIPFFILAYPIALLIALVPSSLFTGKRITRGSSFFQKRGYLLSFIGLFILFVLLLISQLLQIGGSVLNSIGSAISLLTLFIFYLYFTFGLGSLILSRVGTKKP